MFSDNAHYASRRGGLFGAISGEENYGHPMTPSKHRKQPPGTAKFFADLPLALAALALGFVIAGLSCKLLCARNREPVYVGPSRDQNMQRIIDWGNKNGAYVHPKVQLRPRSDVPDSEWGFFTTGKIEENEILFGMPKHMLISSQTALLSLTNSVEKWRQKTSLPPEKINMKHMMESVGLNGEYLNLQVSEELASDEWFTQTAIMSLFLYLHWDDTDHFFYPYFATLPRACTMSVCWPKEKLEQTFTPPKVRWILEDRKYYEDAAINLGLDVSSFLHKVSVVSSRCWGGGSTVQTLVPLQDMVNHHPYSETWAAFYNSNVKGSYVPLEGESYASGDEVFITYGDKDNAGLLVNYGFHTQPNPHDKCDDLQKSLSDEFMFQNLDMQDLNCQQRPVKRRWWRRSSGIILAALLVITYNILAALVWFEVLEMWFVFLYVGLAFLGVLVMLARVFFNV
eukprot:g52685.t1